MPRVELLVFVVEAGEPCGKALHGRFEFGMEIDKRPKLFSQPAEGDSIVSPSFLKLLNSPVSEVHSA
jgi:hypothetical protein